MTKTLNIELFLEEKEVISQIHNNSIICEKNLLPMEYDYKHLSKKHKYLIDNKLEFVRFNSELSIIGKFNGFLTLPYLSDVKNILFEYDSFTTLSPLDVRTKSNSLMLAFYCGIINDFIGEDLTLTHTGELPTENYDFFIISDDDQRQKISLRNYSSYIDGVFEGQNKVVLLINELYKTEDISLKELFLPYLYFNSKTSKELIVTYMSFSNDIFKLYEVNFNNTEVLNSASIDKFQSYKISNDKIIYDDIINVLNSVQIVKEKEIPFPQANDFDKIIDLIHLLNISNYSFDEVTENYGFVGRQTNYYTDAGIYLDLIQIKVTGQKKAYTLTNRGREIVSSRIKNKYLKLMECVLEHNVFNKSLKLYIENSTIPSTAEIVKIMKDSKIYNVNSESTFIRRASTVQSWIKWIINLPKIYY